MTERNFYFYFSENLDSYKDFLDQVLMKKIFEYVKDTRYKHIILDLNATWFGTSATRRLPWIVVFSIKNTLSGFANSNPPIPLRACQEFIGRIANEAEPHNIHMSANMKKVLGEKFHETCEQLKKSQENYWQDFDIEELWKALLSREEFVVSLWMSEVNAYAQLYFAYEVCFIDLIKTYSNIQSLRTGSDFTKQISKHLPRELIDYCWKKEAIDKARLIRHAITHNGRRMTKDLSKYRDHILLHENEIIIFPEETTELFNTLADSIEYFCKWLIIRA